MGTRSTVKFFSEFQPDEVLCCVYQQIDGYLSGVGHDLANFLKDKQVINGFNEQTMAQGFAIGMGCLAAQYIKSIKTELGGVYMSHAEDSQEYDYEVRLVDGQLIITVRDFKGTPQELLDYKEPEE